MNCNDEPINYDIGLNSIHAMYEQAAKKFN